MPQRVRYVQTNSSPVGPTPLETMITLPALSAMTDFTLSLPNAPKTQDDTKVVIIWRAATAAGQRAFRMQPSGAVTSIGTKKPSLFGTSGNSEHLSACTTNAVVTLSVQLTPLSTCGEVPAKSNRILFFSRVSLQWTVLSFPSTSARASYSDVPPGSCFNLSISAVSVR